jgi:hypothetical protein
LSLFAADELPAKVFNPKFAGACMELSLGFSHLNDDELLTPLKAAASIL